MQLRHGCTHEHNFIAEYVLIKKPEFRVVKGVDLEKLVFIQRQKIFGVNNIAEIVLRKTSGITGIVDEKITVVPQRDLVTTDAISVINGMYFIRVNRFKNTENFQGEGEVIRLKMRRYDGVSAQVAVTVAVDGHKAPGIWIGVAEQRNGLHELLPGCGTAKFGMGGSLHFTADITGQDDVTMFCHCPGEVGVVGWVIDIGFVKNNVNSDNGGAGMVQVVNQPGVVGRGVGKFYRQLEVALFTDCYQHDGRIFKTPWTADFEH